MHWSKYCPERRLGAMNSTQLGTIRKFLEWKQTAPFGGIIIYLHLRLVLYLNS